MATRSRAPRYTPKYEWDHKHRLLDYHGQMVVFFGRSNLAKALNRSVAAIRAMELKGVLCHPRLKDPTRGHWLYTESQILDLVKLAEEEGVINPNLKRPFSIRFKEEAWAILSRLP